MSTDAGVPPPVENRLHLYDRESHMKFLVDSGSVVSLLPRVAVNKRLSPQKFALYAANSTTITTYGQQVFTLNLSLCRALKWTFIVADVQTAILGTDFLANFGLMVDVKRRRLVDPLTALAVQGECCRFHIFRHDLPERGYSGWCRWSRIFTPTQRVRSTVFPLHVGRPPRRFFKFRPHFPIDLSEI